VKLQLLNLNQNLNKSTVKAPTVLPLILMDAMLPFICKSCRRAMRIAPPAVNHGSVAASLNQNLNKSTVKAPTVLVNFDGRDITFYFPQSFSVTMSWPVLQWQRRRRKIAITVTTSRRRTCQIKHRTRRARDRRARTPVS